MKKRVYAFDNLKFLLILFVVIGHLIEPYINKSHAFKSIFIFIYCFHMPAFIFISGLFSKKILADRTLVKEKVTFFLSLYILLKIFIFLLSLLYYQKAAFTLFTAKGLPWFMLAMAAFYLLAFFTRDMNQCFLLAISILLACFSGYDTSIGDFLCLSRIIVYFPFFLLGTMFDPGQLLEFTKKPAVRICGITGLILLLYAAFFQLDSFYAFRPLFTGRNPFQTLPSPAYGALYRFIYYIAVVIIILGLICVIPRGKYVFSTWGQRTLQVYFFHFALIYPIRLFHICDIMSEHLPHGVWQILFLMLGGAICLIFSARVFEYPFSFISRKCHLTSN